MNAETMTKSHRHVGKIKPAKVDIIVGVAMALSLFALSASAQSWSYTFPYDGSASNGTWAQVQLFSETKTHAYYLSQGRNLSCTWATSEPNPPHTLVGSWGGGCSGTFDVTWSGCPAGTSWVVSANACIPIVDINDPNKPPEPCSGSGNPIYPMTGSKSEFVDTGLKIGPMTFSFHYDSRRKVPVVGGAAGPTNANAGVLGELWSSNLQRQVVVQASQNGALVARGDGNTISFQGSGAGVYTADADISDRLTTISGGFRYVDASTRSEETYDTSGRLVALTSANGDNVTLTYSTASTPTVIAPAPGYLIQAQDNRGRVTSFRY